jgi:hypothetical protein
VAQATRVTRSLPAQRIEQLTEHIDVLNQPLTWLVEPHAPQLLIPMGIGPDSAVTLLITMGDNPERLNTEASFAAQTPHPGGQDPTRDHPMPQAVCRPRGLHPGQDGIQRPPVQGRLCTRSSSWEPPAHEASLK